MCLIFIIFVISTGCSNKDKSEKVEYQILFKGFATINESDSIFSSEIQYLIFTSEEDWIDFCNKHFDSFPSVITEINDRAIDFQKENLVFIYFVGPRHSYDFFWDIRYLAKKDGGLEIKFDNKKEVVEDTIYVLNNKASENSLTKHAVVYLLSVKPEDIEDILKKSTNLYKKE